MGKERDELIRRLGGVPVSDSNLSDAELQARYIRYYARQGRLPPEITAIREKALIRKKPGLSRRARGQRDG